MALVVSTYGLTSTFPKSEMYGLTSEVQRAAVSIPTNIADGNARGSRRDYARFIDIARGSVAELDTLLLICQQVGIVEGPVLQTIMAQSDEIGRMLNTLKQKLSSDRPGFDEPAQTILADDLFELH